jgi:MiaB/RimO family radical SAM methylthiotransferase
MKALNMKGFSIADNACGRRLEETEMVRKFLLTNGWTECCNYRQADLIIFFACGYNHSVISDMLTRINKTRGLMKNGAELIVGGCLSITDRKRLKEVFNEKPISPGDFSALNSLPDIKIKIEAFRESYSSNGIRLGANHADQKNVKRGFLKKLVSRCKVGLPGERVAVFLSSGCLRQCSYCAIRFATGRLKSKPLDAVMRQFKENLKLGHKQFEFYGDCLGDYGLDIGTDLGELLDRVLSMDGDFSIGIHDLHPSMFIKYFEKIVVLCRAKAVHRLCVPLQSGNERILKLMRRPCDTNDLREKLLEIKKFKKVFMETSIIVGFPTETEEEFRDTVDFLKDIGFDNVFVHFYSDMPNTESSKMAGKIDKNTMLNRLNGINSAAINHNAGTTRREWENIPIR